MATVKQKFILKIASEISNHFNFLKMSSRNKLFDDEAGCDGNDSDSSSSDGSASTNNSIRQFLAPDSEDDEDLIDTDDEVQPEPVKQTIFADCSRVHT